MVDPERDPLSGLIEVDETALAFRTKNDPVAGGAGRSHDGKLLPRTAAVEVGDGNGFGVCHQHRLLQRPSVPTCLVQVFSNLLQLRAKHLQSYLDEFVFRFNRRRTRHAAFRSLFGIAVCTKPFTYNMLVRPEAGA